MKFILLGFALATGLVAADDPVQPNSCPVLSNNPFPGDKPPPACTPGATVSYTVQSGDELGDIATRLGSGLCNIAWANGIGFPFLLQPGQIINVPTWPCNIDNTTCLNPAIVVDTYPNPPKLCGYGLTVAYTVHENDKLCDLALKFKTGVCNIINQNNLTSPYAIEAGQILSITTDVCYPDSTACYGSSTTTFTPVIPSSTPSCISGSRVNYTIISGDTLTIIATRFDSGICNIAYDNNITNPDLIYSGQNITLVTHLCNPDNKSCLRSNPYTARCVVGGPPTYTVQAGQTFLIIAEELHISTDALIQANSDVNPNTLYIGQVIWVPVCIGLRSRSNIGS